MSTREAIEVIEDTGFTDLPDDGLCHMAHVYCQRSAPYVTSFCRIALDWGEKNPDPKAPVDCPRCAKVERCPVCDEPRAGML